MCIQKFCLLRPIKTPLHAIVKCVTQTKNDQISTILVCRGSWHKWYSIRLHHTWKYHRTTLWNAVAAPEGRSRVGFSLCEAAERWRREERGVEAPQAPRRAPKARGSRRHRRRGGRVWGGGIPLPIRLGCLGERRKLPQRGLGRSHSRNRFWCILPLKSDLWANTNIIQEESHCCYVCISCCLTCIDGKIVKFSAFWS